MQASSKSWRNRFLASLGRILGLAFVIIYGVWLWTPWEFDFIKQQKQFPGHVDPGPQRLFSHGTRVMVITAHPDDAEFYLGGTLTKLGRAGADIQLVACTDGDKGYYPFEDYKRNRKVRQGEQTAASQIWHGRTPIFLGFPDGRLSASEPLVRALERQMESFAPDYVFAFDGRYPPRLSHRDHRRAGIAAENACYRYRKAGWLMRFSTNSANWYSDISDLWDEKYALLQVHASQFHGKRLDGVAAMVYDSAERDGEKAGVTLAEGLRCEPNPGR